MTSATQDGARCLTYARPCDVIMQLGTDTLDAEDRARADRMSDKVRHQHFIAGRALLRHQLSCVVEHAVGPSSWRLAEGLHGKPSIAPGLPQVHFNISHADGLVMVATSPSAPIGIDLERITGTQDASPALDQLTGCEHAWLNQHGEADRWSAFLKLWTAKEAVSKATGLGCDVDFHDIEVDVSAGRARCPDGLLDAGDHINIDLHTMKTRDTAYCLSIAGIQAGAGTHSVN